jgi:L,D-transpeptidase-like protein
MECSASDGSFKRGSSGSPTRVRVRAALTAGGAAAAVLAALMPAAAAGPHGKREQPQKLQVPLIAVSIADQRLTVYDKGQVVAHAPVSTGMAGHATPTGIFSVLQKETFHRSNIYSGAPMPFMQRITWSGIALHAGVLPGYPASHGCIRMPEEFAVRLYHLTQRGARVVIARHVTAPVPFENAHLLAFAKPLDGTASVTMSGVAAAGPMVKTAESKTPVVMSDAVDPPARAIVGLAPKTGDLDVSSQPRPADPSAIPTLPALINPVPIIPTQQVAPAAAAPARQDALEPYGPERPLRPGPITVFVSKKEGKVFVRKGFEQILAMPVTIAHPEAPLGTHILTAVTAKSDGATFEWVSMSLSGDAPKRIETKLVTDRRGRRIEKAVAVAAPPTAAAAAALDRIEFPPEAQARIASLMSPGATLIISDQGLGSETGTDDTDFIVLTH